VKCGKEDAEFKPPRQKNALANKLKFLKVVRVNTDINTQESRQILFFICMPHVK